MTQLKELVGFETGDGLFCPGRFRRRVWIRFVDSTNLILVWCIFAGGSVSNMYGMNVARYHKFPEVKCKGMQALPKTCIFTSELVCTIATVLPHYSADFHSAVCDVMQLSFASQLPHWLIGKTVKIMGKLTGDMHISVLLSNIYVFIFSTISVKSTTFLPQLAILCHNTMCGIDFCLGNMSL